MVIIVLEYSPSAILMPEKSYSSIIGKFPLQSFSKLLACFTVSRGIVFFSPGDFWEKLLKFQV